MDNVIEINQKRYFTLPEARSLLPVVKRITQTAYQDVQNLTTQLSYIADSKMRGEIEERIRTVFQDWYEKIRKLGCESKGLWLVDFDSGEGYFCWHFPEDGIDYFHGYFDGYQGRVRLN